MKKRYQKTTFRGQLCSMLAVDFRRMLMSPLFRIMLGIALVMPVLILVMTTMMDGSITVDPQTGAETVMEGFDHVWQAIGNLSTDGDMGMDIVSMCNINLIFFMAAVFVSLFVGDDFRSGYVKNLFAVRAKKGEYVISKTVTGFVAGALMLICFFFGSMIGGAVAGLPFAVEGVTTGGIVLCMLSKVCLMLVFIAIDVTMSVIGKQKTWLSMLLALGAGMMLFAMIPMLTPLDATLMNVLLCLVGGVLFAIGLGVVSRLYLEKIDIL